MGLSKKTRFDVFKRDLFTCQYCGRRPPEVVLEVDHIIAKAKDGSDDPDNLTTSCDECNQGKSDRSLGNTLPIVDEMQRLEAIQEMQERAVMLKKQTVAAEALRSSEDDAINMVEGWWIDATGYEEFFERESVRGFLRRLSPERILDAIRAMEALAERRDPSRRQLWKYFCGCCWGMIRADEKVKPEKEDFFTFLELEEEGHVPDVPTGDGS